MSGGGSPGLVVVGGGSAGLAAGLFARRAGKDFSVLEAESEPGGLCRTLHFGEFLVDTGAHRFHDKIPSSTAVLRELMGDELAEVTVPSEIFEAGRFTRFPLEPGNLLKTRGPAFIAASVADLIRSRLRSGGRPAENFAQFALSRYGAKVARPYLLNYSEKLWGISTDRLSMEAAGSRLRGLKPTTMFSFPRRRKSAASPHFEGTFLYPRRGGIAAISRALSEACGIGNVRCGARISRIIREETTIRAVEINGRETLRVESLISTIPITSFLGMLDPPPPETVLRAASGLRFRSLALGILLLDQPDITRAATVYFPGAQFPFTRVFEPNRRSPAMSPPGKTSLVAEFPCDFGDATWEAGDEVLLDRMIRPLASLGWVRNDRILSASVIRLHHAYPILSIDTAARLENVFEFLRDFRNLASAGRYGLFRYSHIHNQIFEARAAVEALAAAERI
jgi:protoporphyrinogen oxidase